MGILNEATKTRMEELQQQRTELIAARAELDIDFGIRLTREMIDYYLREMAALNIEEKECQKRLMQTFVNAIYLYDDHFDIAFNYTDGNGNKKISRESFDNCVPCSTKSPLPHSGRGFAVISLLLPLSASGRCSGCR